jgi:hypothetical protein
MRGLSESIVVSVENVCFVLVCKCLELHGETGAMGPCSVDTNSNSKLPRLQLKCCVSCEAV